jgi:ribose transport system substrate-binding protein
VTKGYVFPVALLVSGGLLLAGCSSSSSSSAPPAPSNAEAAAGVAAAKQYIQSYNANPTTIVLDTPVPQAPPKGKFIIKLTTPEPVSTEESNNAAAACAALGWTFRSVMIGSTADGPAKAFEAAMQLKPDGIIISGYPKVSYSVQLAAAKAAGIPVVSESTSDAGGTGDGIIANIDGPTQVQAWGKLIAAAIVVDSGGNADVLSVNVPSYPILNAYVDGLKTALAQWAPQVKVTDLDIQASDIGTKVGAAVVSATQADPNINYASFSFGDLSIGIPSALNAAGVNLKIVGETPSPANIQAIKNGTETAWIGFPAPLMGWRDIDAFVRHYAGGDAAKAALVASPTQILNKNTVNGAILNANGYYIGVADYPAQFKKLWLVK